MIAAFYAKLSKQEKLLLVAAFVCVVVVAMDFLVIGPILSHMKLLDAEIEAKTQTINRNLRILSYRDSIVSEYEGYSDYFDSGGKSEDEIVASLLKEIEFLANQKSITISSITPGESEGNPVFREYKTTLECEGLLTNVLGFINLLEESVYLFQITDIHLMPKSKNSDVMKCSISLSRIFITAEEIP